MDNQFFKNQYVLERMIVWLTNPLELNLCQFDSSERDDIWKNIIILPPWKR